MESKDPEYLKLFRAELMYEKTALIEFMDRINHIPNDIIRIEKINRISRYGRYGYKNKYTDTITPHIKALAFVQDAVTGVDATIKSLDDEKTKIDRMIGLP